MVGSRGAIIVEPPSGAAGTDWSRSPLASSDSKEQLRELELTTPSGRLRLKGGGADGLDVLTVLVQKAS